MKEKSRLGPGEANTRRRRRRQYIYFAVSAVVGGLIGAIIASGESSFTDLLLRGGAGTDISPVTTIAAIALVLFGFLFLILWGFTQIDEHLREQNLIGFTGAAIAVLNAYPVWTLLHAGGFSSPPTAFGIWAVAFIAMILSFLFAKIRDNIAF